MTNSVSPADSLLSISAVERDTGLSKDVLRKWEARYGFPVPSRDENGERVYPGAQVDRLRLVKRLLDSGLRPSGVVGQPPEVLSDLLERHLPKSGAGRADDFEVTFLEGLRRHDTPVLRQGLNRLILREGVSRFIQQRASRLIATVGEAWARGELEIYEEHLFSELMQSLLGGLIDDLNDERGAPRLLLTTLPDEPHGLGLLMAAALAALEGAYCLTLGTQTPVLEIRNATQARLIDAVALSFSGIYPARKILPALEEVRQGLPPSAELWVGGAGTARLSRVPEGVHVLSGLGDVVDAIADWRARQSP